MIDFRDFLVGFKQAAYIDTAPGSSTAGNKTPIVRGLVSPRIATPRPKRIPGTLVNPFSGNRMAPVGGAPGAVGSGQDMEKP